jgi:hypothetical protein
MQQQKIIILIISLIFLIPALGFAYTFPKEVDVDLPEKTNQYYVDLDAPRNGDGSSTSPWDSWQNALSGIKYANFPAWLYVKGNQTIDGDFSWNVGGIGAGSELVITNWPGETAVTTMIVGDTKGWRLSANYVIIDGGSQSSPYLKWYNTDNSGGYTMRVMDTVNQSSCIRRVEIEGGRSAIAVMGGTRIYNNVIHSPSSHGIYLSGSTTQGSRSPLVIGNIVYNAGRNGIQHNPHDTNRQIVNGVTSHNLLFNNSQHGMTILSGTGSGGTIKGLRIYNNLCWGNNSNAVKFSGGTDYNGTISGVEMINNTFYGGITNQHGNESAGEPATTVFRNNIVTGSIYHATACNFINASNVLESYPISNFVSADAGSNDFLKLKDTATDAIGVGYDTSAVVTDDFFGISRNDGAVDIGASEVGTSTNGGGSQSPPSAPTNLEIAYN